VDSYSAFCDDDRRSYTPLHALLQTGVADMAALPANLRDATSHPASESVTADGSPATGSSTAADRCFRTVHAASEDTAHSLSDHRKPADPSASRVRVKANDVHQHEPVDTIVIAGLALDYCVRSTALDGIVLGYHVYVVWDACKPVHTESDAVQNLESALIKAGVRIIRATQLLSPCDVEPST